MALINKNGLTPSQVTIQKELLDRFNALETQNAALDAHITELMKEIKVFQRDTNRSCSQTIETIKSERKDLSDDIFNSEIRIKSNVDERQWVLKMLLSFLIALLFLSIGFTYSVNKTARNALDGVYMINNLLRGDTSFWYDADNHQLYVRSREDTGQ